MKAGAKPSAKDGRRYNRKKKIQMMKRDYQLYLFLLLPLAFLIIFSYFPMYGVLIAFQKFSPVRGVLGSTWVGFDNFIRFFTTPSAINNIKNTVMISLYSLLAGAPFPILLAILLNECTSVRYKKAVQMITYAPYFISTVVLVSILMQLLDVRTGIVNMLVTAVGGKAVDFFGNADYFRSVYVWSGIWQSTGFNAIIYISALASIDQSLYEAAKIDGASRFQKILRIDLPLLLPTFTILFILSCGSIMSVGFEKVYLMQNPANLRVSEVLSTYTYKLGLVNLEYGFSAAVGIFNSLVNTVFLVAVNSVARRIGDTSLW
ncbi:MAG: ABC transporter permease [Oscillospiraceae bacterium]